MFRPVLALLILVAFTAPSFAQACEMTTSAPEVTTPGCGIDATLPCYYVDNDPCHTSAFLPRECVFSIWIYQESNGIPGLQRGDEVRDDTCGGIYPMDTIIL